MQNWSRFLQFESWESLTLSWELHTLRPEFEILRRNRKFFIEN